MRWITKLSCIASQIVLSLLLAPASWPQSCKSCVYSHTPSYGAPVELPYNQEDPNCWTYGSGANVDCSGAITKTVTYSIQFPNSYNASSGTFVAYGSSDSANTCVDGDRTVGPPYFHVPCWPQFYTPVTGDGYFMQETHDEWVTYLESICGLYGNLKWAMGCNVGVAVNQYVWDPCN